MSGGQTDILGLTADIVAAYVGNNPVPPSEVPGLLGAVHGALGSLNDAADPLDQAAPKAERPKPAVPISRSVQPDHIVCLEDGKKLTMLKRYLRTHYNMSPEEYRRRWGLSPDYPMVAPEYAERRSQFAKAFGLGKGGRRKG